MKFMHMKDNRQATVMNERKEISLRLHEIRRLVRRIPTIVFRRIRPKIAAHQFFDFTRKDERNGGNASRENLMADLSSCNPLFAPILVGGYIERGLNKPETLLTAMYFLLDTAEVMTLRKR